MHRTIFRRGVGGQAHGCWACWWRRWPTCWPCWSYSHTEPTKNLSKSSGISWVVGHVGHVGHLFPQQKELFFVCKDINLRKIIFPAVSKYDQHGQHGQHMPKTSRKIGDFVLVRLLASTNTSTNSTNTSTNTGPLVNVAGRRALQRGPVSRDTSVRICSLGKGQLVRLDETSEP